MADARRRLPVWTVDLESQALVSLDPKTRSVAGAPIPVGGRPGFLAFGAGSLWINDRDAQSIERIDPVTRSIVASIPLGFNVSDLAFAQGVLCVARDGEVTLTTIDPATNRILASESGHALRVWGMAADPEGVWLADDVSGTLRLVKLH